MKKHSINAEFREFAIPPKVSQRGSVIIPAVKGTWWLKYGTHSYYFYNFETMKGFNVDINHSQIIKPGLERFHKANYRKYKYFSKLRSIFQKYHYGFKFLEQIMLMTVPHTITPLGDGRFRINLWSYFGYIDVDCQKKSVQYVLLEEEDDDQIFGSQQWYDFDNDELYYMTYPIKDALKRSVDSYHKVFSTIYKQNNKTREIKELWKGNFADNMHEIVLNKTKQYCVICEMGMFLDEKDRMIPSKVIILDLKNNKHWIISKFIVAAHAQFDPEEPDIIYFSNHNFQFKHSNIVKFRPRNLLSFFGGLAPEFSDFASKLDVEWK